MLQRGVKTVPSGGQTSSDGPSGVARGRQQRHDQLQPDCPRFPEWIDSPLDPTDTEISHLVSIGRPSSLKINHKRCCKTSTSSGYSSHSPPPSAGSYASPTRCPITGTSRGSTRQNPPPNGRSNVGPTAGHPQQQCVGTSGLAVIHEAETIPRPIWPTMDDDDRDAFHTSASSAGGCDGTDCDVAAGHAAALAVPNDRRRDPYLCCGYCCVCTAPGQRNSTTGNTSAPSTSARRVLLELSRTLNSVIDADNDLCAEEILRDISMTVARGIRSNDPTFSGTCEDYTYRLSSSSSSAGGKESAGVNPVNLRVYSKPKWRQVPASSKSSSNCPYEGKFLLTGAHRTSRTQPAFGKLVPVEGSKKIGELCPTVFLVPQGHCGYPRNLQSYPGRGFKVEEYEGAGGKTDAGSGKFDGAKRTHPVGRLNAGPGENCGDKYPTGEPVYSTLDASDESSSYGAIDEPPTKKVWNEGAKVFDRHLDFTLDGNRAERLGRAIANAKRRRQWCRGITAIFGLVFFVLSVVVVSLSVTKGRKVFGSM